MLTGALPFQADTLAAIMHHHFFTPAPDVTKVREDIPAELTAILTRVLSKDPDRRYPTTDDMLAAVDGIPLSDADRAAGEAMLRGLAGGTPVPAVRTSALPPLEDTMAVVAAHDAFRRSSERRRRVRRRVSGASAVVVASVLGLWLWRRPLTVAATTPGGGPHAPGGAEPVNATPQTVSAPAPVVTPRATPFPPGTTAVVPQAPAPVPVQPSAMRESTAQPPADTATGKLRVRAFPGDALIMIDNETIGQGAVVDRDVLAGERRLRIMAPGYVDFDTTIVITAGTTTRLSAIELKAVEP
jgi:hypothetical protein